MEDLMLGIATNCLTAGNDPVGNNRPAVFPGDAGNYRSGSVSDLCAGNGQKK